MNPKVNFNFDQSKKWHQELKLLRTIILDCNLQEELKWGCPCYILSADERKSKSANIVLIHVFKEYCAILFFKGALMKDPNGILIQQTENVQAARQVRFTHVEEVIELKSALKAYVLEAIEIEKAGLKVELKSATDYNYPAELEQKFNEDADFMAAFKALTPGQQRAYSLYFSAAKQVSTRVDRIEKSLPNILNGKGLNDK